jgi:hypothetical protein
LEIYDAIPVLTDKPSPHETECKMMNIVTITQEFCKCVEYICTNVDINNHVRSMNKNSAKSLINMYINSYILKTTIDLLRKIGSSIQSAASTIEISDEIELLIKDVEHYNSELNKFYLELKNL